MSVQAGSSWNMLRMLRSSSRGPSTSLHHRGEIDPVSRAATAHEDEGRVGKWVNGGGACVELEN
jgi:hypothetical protein